MADHKYRLFNAVDPSKVKVPFNQKFANLTLSSLKNRQQVSLKPKDQPERKNPREKRLQETDIDTMRVNVGAPLCGENPKDSQPDLDSSDYMDALQLSADGCSQDVANVADMEQISAGISNLTMQPKEQQEISICISSTTDDASCITISDSSEDEEEPLPPDSMAVSDRTPISDQEAIPPPTLTTGKVQRIEAFLRDVSMERREMERNGPPTPSPLSSTKRQSRLAEADTESMSPSDEASYRQPPVTRPIDSSKRLADNETQFGTICSAELTQMDCSKRLADDETEANTLESEDLKLRDVSKRLADNDTELNTLYSNSSGSHNSTLHEEEEQLVPEESIEIPETGSEGEPTPQKPSSSGFSTSGEDELGSIQVSSINISAKINIKISIPTMESSSTTDDEQQYPSPRATKSLPSSEAVQHQRQQERPVLQKSMLSTDDASEDEQFLTQAEKLLNQLYGKSWQTPDVIRTLKRSSGSGRKAAAPLRPRNTPAIAATTVKKKKPPPPPIRADESALGDFSIFTRALRSTNQTPLNSTRLPPVRAVQTEGRLRTQKPVTRPRTNHVDEDRWRMLIDSESGTDASDDDDADATFSESGCNTSSDSDEQGKQDKQKAGDITYLDLTKDEVEVISNPDEDSKTPKFHRRLDDILRSCRASAKPKLPVAPAPKATTRRQLFTPNAGFENDTEAREIVDKALDLDMLEELENDYLPGTPVYKRVQEVRKELGIERQVQVTPQESPILKLLAPNIASPNAFVPPKATEPPKSTARKPRKQKELHPALMTEGKCGFLKSLEGQVSRELADSEALFYRENFAKNKERLAEHLYNMFNAEVFNNELVVPITWSKRLRNTAGRCMNKRRHKQCSSVVELSVKVLTTADRLRCTLIHELCHAAAWVFNGEGGHGRVWKMWAQRANDKFPDLPQIKVCHNYSIDFKYTYKCLTCNTNSNAHSRSRKVENLRCSTCRGPITLFLNKKDKQGNIVSKPAGEAKGFAKFVKDNFKKHKRENMTAAQVMRVLSVEFAKEKGQPTGETTASIATQLAPIIVDD
ncbi:germ cell nuclear acidic protein isoform X1 [Drosophila gunungcola]|uniref:germ cell nuclear acidic protein isoform X1 n=1 Tax=Drosophila gunungcola TaxID=103775 RepID=UPI0022E55D58|nr:germ cell nuclear acidic protein isoform X1 [Drosophila gunungcola]